MVGIPVNNRVYGIEEPDDFPIPASSRAYGIEEPDLAYGIEEPEFPAEETPDHGGFPSSFQSSYGESRTCSSLSARFQFDANHKKVMN